MKPRQRLANAEIRARNSGKLKSWNRQMAMARRPWVRLFSDCSVSCDMVMAVEDMWRPLAADDHRHGGSDIEQRIGAGRHEGGGDEHLRAADSQHFPAHGHEPWQGKFQAQCEHQEHHAEVRR